jgi:Spy/CpxP family protein refolding chaperone
MKRMVIALGLVGMLVLTASAAFAWGPGWGRGFGPPGYGAGYGPPAWAHGFGPGYGPGLPVANLSADQIAKIKKIQSDRYAEMTTLRTELFTKHRELAVLYREPTVDRAKIAAKEKEVAALQAQMREKALAARTEVAEVLTPEQRAQLPTFGPGMGPGFGPGRGFGPRMGYGPPMGFGPRW